MRLGASFQPVYLAAQLVGWLGSYGDFSGQPGAGLCSRVAQPALEQRRPPARPAPGWRTGWRSRLEN